MTSKILVVPSKSIVLLDKSISLDDVISKPDEYGYPTGEAKKRINDTFDAITIGRNDFVVKHLEECLEKAPWFTDGWILYFIAYTDYLTGFSLIRKFMKEF